LCGEDFLALGYKGREIADALEFLLNAVMDDKVENIREALIEYLKNFNN
jgi:hypothetical protein